MSKVRFFKRESSHIMGGGGKVPKYLDFGVRITCIIRTLGNWVGIAPHPSLSPRKHHRRAAIQTGYVYFFCGSDRIPAAGADIFPCAGRARRRGALRSAVRPCPGDMEPGKLVAAYENVGQAVL